MKKGFKFSVMLIIAVVMMFAMFAAACEDDGKKHVCEHVCPICGLCTDPECDDPVCAEKCQGHKPHECESECPVCGKCLDMECEEEVCADKCGADHTNAMEYAVTDLKVAKSGVTVDTAGYVSDFNLSNEASISYQFNAAKAMTVTMSVFVRRTVESSVYTDYVNVLVNDKKVSSPATVPALSNTAAAMWSEVNLGCISLNEGKNVISFVANGNGINAWAFRSIKLYFDTARIDWQLAQGVAHTCESVCATCGGCTDFSCYNPGCANKCTCVNQSKAAATLFWALDPRAVASRNPNDELDGIGVTWGKTTTVTYNIIADKAGRVEYGAVISVDTFEILFTDQFKITVNGTPVEAGFGKCPVGEVREWNTYRLVDAGYLDLQEGRNTIVISQTPVQQENGGNGGAYNFQSFVIFSNDVKTEWYEHICTSRCPICEYCTDTACTESACATKCNGHTNPDADFTGYDLTINKDKNYKCAVESFYNYDKLNVIEGKDLFIYDSTNKGLNGRALGVGSRIVVRFNLLDDAAIALRPIMTPVVIPDSADGYTIDGKLKFIVDGHEITDYRLQKADKGGWSAGEQYVNATQGNVNFSAGTHTFIIEITGADVPHINEIRLNVQSYGSWDEAGTHFCSQICPDCGGCKDMECTAPECEKKCTCAEHVLTKLDAAPESCSKSGNIECYYCADCGKYFADAEAAQELDYETEVMIPANPEKHVEATNGRNNTAVTCRDCGKLFRYQFAVNDDRVTRSRAIDGETQAIGAKWNTETSFSFDFVAEKAGTATLYVTMSKNTAELVFTDKIATTLNGEKLALAGKIPAFEASDTSSFVLVEVGEVTLKEGPNTIGFAYTPVKVNKGGDGIFYNILAVSFSEEVKVGWTTHVCESYCETCGGCKNDECAEAVCANKCECVNPFTFYAVDEETVISGSTKKNTNENCVGMQSGKAASLTYTLNASAGGKVKLYVCLTGNTVANAFSSIYTVKINGVQITTDAVIHTAADKWIDYKPVYIGEYDLSEGQNTIEISWVAGSSSEVYYNLRSIGIDAAEGAVINYYSESTAG